MICLHWIWSYCFDLLHSIKHLYNWSDCESRIKLHFFLFILPPKFKMKVSFVNSTSLNKSAKNCGLFPLCFRFVTVFTQLNDYMNLIKILLIFTSCQRQYSGLGTCFVYSWPRLNLWDHILFLRIKSSNPRA